MYVMCKKIFLHRIQLHCKYDKMYNINNHVNLLFISNYYDIKITKNNHINSFSSYNFKKANICKYVINIKII